MDASDEISVSVNSEFEGNMIYSLSVDPDENLYVTLVSNKDIIKIERTDDDEKYGSQRVIYTDRWGAPLLPAAFDKNSLLVFGLTDFYFLDPESGSVRELDIPCQRNQSFFRMGLSKSFVEFSPIIPYIFAIFVWAYLLPPL